MSVTEGSMKLNNFLEKLFLKGLQKYCFTFKTYLVFQEIDKFDISF